MIQKHLVEALNRYEKQEEEKKPFLFLENDSKNTRAVSDGSRARLNQTQNWSLNYLSGKKPLLCLEYNKPNKQNVYGINLFKKFSVSN